MQVPATPEDIAAAMDPWEAANGSTDLYGQLATHLGEPLTGALWAKACHVYDTIHAAA